MYYPEWNILMLCRESRAHDGQRQSEASAADGESRLRSVTQLVRHRRWHVFLAAPFSSWGLRQETHAEGCSTTYDTTRCHRRHIAYLQERKWRRLSSCNILLFMTHTPDGGWRPGVISEQHDSRGWSEHLVYSTERCLIHPKWTSCFDFQKNVIIRPLCAAALSVASYLYFWFSHFNFCLHILHH